MKSKSILVIASVLLLSLFSIPNFSQGATRHFDQNGHEIPEAAYRDVVNLWNESLQKKGVTPRPEEASPSAETPLEPSGTPPVQQNLKILPADADTSTETGARKGLLWSLKTPKNTLYFLGSIHVMKKESYPLPSAIEAAYQDSQTIVFETDMEEMSTPEAQAFIAQTGMYTDDQTLEQNIPAPLYESVKKRMNDSGMPLARLNRFKPWLCALTLTTLEFQRLGYKPEYGIDLYFTKKAIKDRKESLFFETIESQLSLFAELSPKEQVSILEQALKDIDNVENMASDIFTAWENGDTEMLNSILSSSFQKEPEAYDLLILQRNRNWVQQLESLLNQEGNVMVIGGCLHFIGENSVLEMLKAKGYEVRQILSDL